MTDNEARARTVANQIAERFGLVDSICAKNGRIGACEKAAFGDCDCPKAMYPDDEKVVSDFITAALQAAEDRGRAAGLRRARDVVRDAPAKLADDPLVWIRINLMAAIDAEIAALSADKESGNEH